MKSFDVAVALLALVSSVTGQQTPVAMPSWLTPYAGAKAETQTALPTRIETTYTTPAKPDEVVAHYQKLFEARTLPFLPNSDGVGISIRAAPTECDLLIKIREQGARTLTRVSCAAKSTGPASSLSRTEVPVDNRSASRKAHDASERKMAERIAQGQAETQRVLAEAEAKHKRRIAKQAAYDQPVDARPRKKRAPPPALRKD